MENNTAQILKNNLILLRRNAHLTQEQFADQLGLSFQAVSKWENGLSCPDIALLPEIARIYGISVGQLFAPIEPEELSRPEPVPESPENSWEQKAQETEARENQWEQKAREAEVREDLWEQKAQEAETQEAETAAGGQPDFTGDFDASLNELIRQAVQQAMKKASAAFKKEPFHGEFHFDPVPYHNFEKAESVRGDGLPWADDGVYRAVLFKGTKLVTPPAENGGTLAADALEGDLLSAFSVTCDTIEGDVRCVLGNLNCDEINGDAVNCGTVNCDEICGDAVQCAAVTCDELNGDAVQCATVNCGEINGAAE